MRFLLLSALLAGTASLHTAVAAPANEGMSRQHADDERAYSPAIQRDGQRNPTGEGVGTSTGTPSDMGPDNNMRVKGAARDDRPGVNLNTERPTRSQGDMEADGSTGSQGSSQPSR